MTAGDLPAVRRWLADNATLADLQIEPRDSVHLHDTYLDTDDWRFHRAGFALRARASAAGREATLKSLAPVHRGAGALDRIEVSEPLSSGGPDSVSEIAGDVGRRVRAVTGSQPLRRLFEIYTARERFAVKRNGSDIGEISLDDTVIGDVDGKPQARVRRVEVESHSAAVDALENLVAALRGGCALELATDSKYDMGLGVAGLTLPRVPETVAPPIDPAMRMDDLARTELHRRLDQWAAHEPGARLGDDPEHLHDLRVAGRRIDATLRLFQDFLPRRMARMRLRVKRLLRVLGVARDLDVQLAALDAIAADLADTEREALDPVRTRLTLERERARSKMLKELDSARAQRSLQGLSEFLADEAPRGRAGRVPAGIALPRLIRRRYRKLRRAADGLGEKSPMGNYHRARGQTKKLRYAVECCAGLYGSKADDFMTATRRLQNRLGELQDSHVATLRLTELAHARRARLPPSTVFLLGRLAERHQLRAVQSRERFLKAYRKVRGRSWKRLRNAMKSTAKVIAPVAADVIATSDRAPAADS